MSQIAPSRQALRYLNRLCRNTSQPQPSLAMKTTIATHHLHCTPVTHLSCHTNPRTFTTSIIHRVQPSTSNPETDPQNQQSTISIPDITTYYTLFPQTLPDGPPAPPPKTQSASASSSPTSESESEPQSKFHIHVPTLRKEFLQLQSLHHPDKYPASTPSHQKSLALSSLINEAYKTLSDPLLRATYLLQLQYDIDVTTEDNAAHPTDQETLMEVMEAQERIEEAENQEEIDEIKEENRTRIRETEAKVGEAFEKGYAESAKDETVRLKYWRSLQQGLDDWEPGKEVRLVH